MAIVNDIIVGAHETYLVESNTILNDAVASGYAATIKVLEGGSAVRTEIKTSGEGGYPWNVKMTEIKTITISGMNTIPSYSFKGATSLKTFTIPSQITTIGSNSFHSSGLESVIFLGNVETINENSFASTISLTKIEMKGTKRPMICTKTYFGTFRSKVYVPINYNDNNFCQFEVMTKDKCNDSGPCQFTYDYTTKTAICK